MSIDFLIVSIALLLAGLAALIWGAVSIIRHAAERRRQLDVPPASAPSGTATGTEPETGAAPTPQPQATTVNSTGQMKEIVAIVGGIVAIMLGMITIFEKLTGLG